MQVSYGGIDFQIVTTNLLQREPVLSEDRTELLFMRTTVDFTMVFNGDATSFAGGAGNFAAVDGANPGQTDAAIRYHLLKPRLAFSLTSDDGDLVLASPSAGSDMDPDNGPHPMSCTVNHVCSKTWRVSWRCAIASIECGPDGSAERDGSPLISNRYSQAQETGLDRLTKLTTRGVSRFRADALDNLNQSADAFRNKCIPGVPSGYQRQAVQVNLSPDGTTLLWNVTDQEMFTSIGATDDPNRGTVEKFEASFSMSTMGAGDGAMPSAFLMARFDGWAMGSKTSSRTSMIGWLARLAIERMSLPNGQVDPATQPTILKVTSSEKIDQPFVELHIDVKFPPPKAVKQGLGPLRGDFLGVDLIKMFSNDGKNPQMPGDNNTRGTTDVLAFAAAIKDACGSVPLLPYAVSGSNGEAGDNYTSASVDVQVSTYDDLQDGETNYSYDAVSSGTYTEMSVQSKWTTNTGKMAAPIAKRRSSTVYSSGGGGAVGTTYSTGGSTSGGDDDDDTPDVEILTLSAPSTTLVVTFEAERASASPIIPNPVTTDDNLVLMEEQISPMAVGLAPDGVTPVFRIGGVFTYAAKKARKPGSALPYGVHPWTDFNYADSMAQIGPESMANGIVDQESDGSGGYSGGGGDA